MEAFSTSFFTGAYIFAMVSVCWWMFLAHAHNGARAYQSLSKHASPAFLDFSIKNKLVKGVELFSIVVCFIIFLCALCNGFSMFFSWIPDGYGITLADGSPIKLSTLLSCAFGISSAIVFGKWILVGICSFWENHAMAKQTDIYFKIIEKADNPDELIVYRNKIRESIKALEKENPFTPAIVSDRLEICALTIDLRLKDIQTRNQGK